MQAVIDFFTSINPIVAALLATTFTWLVTAAGASLVFLFKDLSRSW
ncbi:MAG: ZIP family metal transporter, partial [Candidatus Kapaibacteriota bacterium]